MWKRFIRLLKSIFGGAMTAMEDPKLILEENIRELNNQVPKMNQNIATVKANVVMLEKDYLKNKSEYEDLMSKMRAAINQGRDDIAANFAMRVESLKANLARTQGDLDQARKAYEKAIEIKGAFMREKDKKIRQAQEALRAHERSQWQAKIADVMEQFEVGGVSQTHDEMIQRINEQTAKNEARMDIALDSVDTTGIKIEKEAENLRAMDLVKQMKLEMGMGATSAPEASSTQNVQQQNRDSIL